MSDLCNIARLSLDKIPKKAEELFEQSLNRNILYKVRCNSEKNYTIFFSYAADLKFCKI